MQADERVGVLFVLRLVVMLAGLILFWSTLNGFGATAVAGVLLASSVHSWLLTTGRLAPTPQSTMQAVATHFYIDVATAFGCVLVLLLEISQLVGAIVAVASFLALLLLPVRLHLPVDRRLMGLPYGVIAIAASTLLYWKMDIGVVMAASVMLVGGGALGASTGMLSVVNRLLSGQPPAQT